MSPAGGSQDGQPAFLDSGQPDRAASGSATSGSATSGSATSGGATSGSATSGGATSGGAVASQLREDQEDKEGRPPLLPKPDAAGQSGEREPRGVRSFFGPAGRFFRRIWRRAWVRHVALLLIYIGAGIGATWPRFTYLANSKLPRTTDVASFVWGFWWIAHTVTHLSNPFFTKLMAAPVGIQLGFSTLMPLAGYVMTPVTLLWGPSAAFTSLSLIAPGLLCYAMYRAARLWLNQPGSIAAGAIFGLSSMLMWQNWYHLNIALGIIFLPLTIEAAVRLRRSQKIAPAVWLGIAIGAAVMTSQEGAAIAVLLAAVLIVPWMIGKLFNDRACLRRALVPLGIGAVVALVVAGPQLIAMAQQYLSGGATVPVGTLAVNYTQFGVPLQTLFSPSPRVGFFGLHSLPSGYTFDAAIQGGASVQPAEGLPTFGIVASVLAAIGVVIGWRKRTTWWFLLLWAGCALLALGTSLTIGSSCLVNQAAPGELYGRSCHQYLPLKSHIHWVLVSHSGRAAWEQVRVSDLMPYTWLVRIPWLSGLREADRFAIVGMIGLALLAGIVVQWISRRRLRFAIPLLIIVLGLGILEAGWAGGTDGPPFTPTEAMPTTMPLLDAKLAADHSNSIVLDVPFGLRGGLSLIGSPISERSLLLATSDGHPRAVSYTAWVSRTTINEIMAHPFYRYLMEYQNATSYPTPAQLKVAAADLKTLNIGWVIEWDNLWRENHPAQRLGKLQAYLRELGFREKQETCLVPSKPGTICGGRDEEKVWLLKFIPGDAYTGTRSTSSRHRHH
jgi:hypothetical protein